MQNHTFHKADNDPQYHGRYNWFTVPACPNGESKWIKKPCHDRVVAEVFRNLLQL